MHAHLRPGDLVVAPNGNDAWSGALAEPGDGDGPLLTPEAAQKRLQGRAMRGDAAPATVVHWAAAVISPSAKWAKIVPFSRSKAPCCQPILSPELAKSHNKSISSAMSGRTSWLG